MLVLFSDDRSKIPVLMAFRTTILEFHTNLFKALTIPWNTEIPEDKNNFLFGLQADIKEFW